MGWYVELHIGKNYWSWRKQIPPELSLLFIKNAKAVPLANDQDENDESKFAGYVSTVGKVLKNLDDLGLTREYLISLYSDNREGFIPFILAYFKGLKASVEYFEKEKSSRVRNRKDLLRSHEINEIIAKIEKGNATNEFEAAINLLKTNKRKTWQAYAGEDPPLIPVTMLQDFGSYRDQSLLDASILGTFIEYANEELKEIGWLYEIRLILESSARNARVKIDLSDWIREGGEIYEWINDAIGQLASKAEAYYRTFGTIANSYKSVGREIARKSLSSLWTRTREVGLDNIQKGKNLENLFNSIIETSEDITVLERNLKTETQEIDLVLKNEINSGFWSSLNSPVIFVECKNWLTPVGVPEARIFESKLRDIGNFCRIGFFVAINGVTKPFIAHLSSLRRDGYAVGIITANEIRALIESNKLDVTKWLEQNLARAIMGK